MKPRIWLSPQAETVWVALPPQVRERARANLELLAAGAVKATILTGRLASFSLCVLEPGLDVIYRPAGARLEVLAIRRAGIARDDAGEASRVVGLVLAAGSGEYEGLPLPLAPLAGQPLIAHVTRTLRTAGIDRLIVVLGHAAASIKAQVNLEGAEVVVNPRHHEGLATSLRCGLRLADKADAVLVALANRPFLAPSSVQQLLARYRQSRPPVVLPLYRQQQGHPVLFDSSLLPALSRVKHGGREVVYRYREQVARIAVDDEGVVRKIT
jgi:molybdenum cofactor cytidylyltransferase